MQEYKTNKRMQIEVVKAFGTDVSFDPDKSMEIYLKCLEFAKEKAEEDIQNCITNIGIQSLDFNSIVSKYLYYPDVLGGYSSGYSTYTLSGLTGVKDSFIKDYPELLNDFQLKFKSYDDKYKAEMTEFKKRAPVVIKTHLMSIIRNVENIQDRNTNSLSYTGIVSDKLITFFSGLVKAEAVAIEEKNKTSNTFFQNRYRYTTITTGFGDIHHSRHKQNQIQYENLYFYISEYLLDEKNVTKILKALDVNEKEEDKPLIAEILNKYVENMKDSYIPEMNNILNKIFDDTLTKDDISELNDEVIYFLYREALSGNKTNSLQILDNAKPYVTNLDGLTNSNLYSYYGVEMTDNLVAKISYKDIVSNISNNKEKFQSTLSKIVSTRSDIDNANMTDFFKTALTANIINKELAIKFYDRIGYSNIDIKIVGKNYHDINLSSIAKMCSNDDNFLMGSLFMKNYSFLNSETNMSDYMYNYLLADGVQKYLLNTLVIFQNIYNSPIANEKALDLGGVYKGNKKIFTLDDPIKDAISFYAFKNNLSLDNYDHVNKIYRDFAKSIRELSEYFNLDESNKYIFNKFINTIKDSVVILKEKLEVLQEKEFGTDLDI